MGIGDTGFFVIGEGFYGSANHHGDDDKTNVGGGITGWVEGRYLGSQSRDVHSFGAIAGIQIEIGGD